MLLDLIIDIYDTFIGLKSQSTYNSVHSLNCNNYLNEYFYNKIPHLTVLFPIKDYFYSVISKLDLLISLNVSLSSSNDSSHLQVLLDQAPHLYAFTLTNWFSIKQILTTNYKSFDSSIGFAKQ